MLEKQQSCARLRACKALINLRGSSRRYEANFGAHSIYYGPIEIVYIFRSCQESKFILPDDL
jgi:hypothetical protein